MLLTIRRLCAYLYFPDRHPRLLSHTIAFMDVFFPDFFLASDSTSDLPAENLHNGSRSQ
jgi:hypothetical protein